MKPDIKCDIQYDSFRRKPPERGNVERQKTGVAVVSAGGRPWQLPGTKLWRWFECFRMRWWQSLYNTKYWQSLECTLHFPRLDCASYSTDWPWTHKVADYDLEPWTSQPLLPPSARLLQVCTTTSGFIHHRGPTQTFLCQLSSSLPPTEQFKMSDGSKVKTAWVMFPGPTRWLWTLCTSSSRRTGTLFWHGYQTHILHSKHAGRCTHKV